MVLWLSGIFLASIGQKKNRDIFMPFSSRDLLVNMSELS